MDYIETKEIAKEVRKELKALYPQIKFQVTSKFNSITVNYIDGAIASEIEAVVQKYNGHSGWDSNYSDYTKHSQVEFRGEMVDTHLTYVWINRGFSPQFLSEVLFFVENKYGLPKHEVKIGLHQDGTAYFDSNDFDSLRYYGEVSRRCHCFSSVAAQEQARSDEENRKYEEWKQQEAIATTKLEEELEEVPPITAVIREVEPFFVDGKFAKINKNSSIEEYQEECTEPDGFNIELCQVVEIIELTAAGYDEFIWRLLENFDWLSGKGGGGTTSVLREVEDWSDYTEEEQDLWREGAYMICVLVTAPNRDALLVDPEGYSYARYVGFVDQEAIAQYAKPPKSNVVQFPTWKAMPAAVNYASNISEILQEQIEVKQLAKSIEVITTPYPIEPQRLTFLEPRVEVITAFEFSPVQLSFLQNF